NFIVAQALAIATHRPFIFISSLEIHRENPIFKFNSDSTKPPQIFGVYQIDDTMGFLPYFYNKNLEFSIESLFGKVQIIAYMAKSVGEAFKSRSILDLEAFSILESLHSLRKYISNSKCYLLTDSRVLYYLFDKRVHDSSVKIKRWVLKIISDYPSVILIFVGTKNNLADYLTRQGLPKGDLGRISLKDLEIEDFHTKLPKEQFTLKEWAKFVEENPQYLTISTQQLQAVTYALTQGIANLEDVLDPINILKEKLSRARIIEAQDIQFQDIKNKCLQSENFSFSEMGKNKIETTYKLDMDLLLIKRGDSTFKIFIPDSLIGPILAYLHLIGHMGTGKMIDNLKNYYFPHKYTEVKRFVGMCHPCFLTHKSSRKNILGEYPVPTHPFEEVSMDLAENLNTVKGYSHLLIVICVLTDYVIIHPMKSKTSAELAHIFMYSIFQSFNIKRVHSDNGPAFRNKEWLKLMAALKIKVIDASANNPSSRGKAERTVQQVKLIMKKILALASSKTLNWEFVPLFVSKAMNQTITPKTGFAPIEMVMGKSKQTESFLDLEPLFPMHHSVKNYKEEIEKINSEIADMCKIAQQKIYDLREETHFVLNKNRIDKKLKFKSGDIVFALDRYNLPGNSRPLKTTFLPSPYVVIEPYFTTTLIERIADRFRTLISNDDIKKYNPKFPLHFVSNLPKAVTEILINSYEDLLPQEFAEISKLDTLKIPPGLNVVGDDENGQNFSPTVVRGRAPSGPDDIFNNPSPSPLGHTDEDDDFIIFSDNDNVNDSSVPANVGNVQQEEDSEDIGAEDTEDKEDRRREDSRELQLRGRRVTFGLP
ncbi:MAG: hypothetical protein EHM77_06210, partial [Planctomycetaceae bacterium]